MDWITFKQLHCYLYKPQLQLTSYILWKQTHTTLILIAHLVSKIVSSCMLKFAVCRFMCSCSTRSWHCSGWSAPAQWGKQRFSRPGSSSSLWWVCLWTFVLILHHFLKSLNLKSLKRILQTQASNHTNCRNSFIIAEKKTFSWSDFLFVLSSRQRAWPITYSWPQNWTFLGVSVSQTALWTTSLHLCVPSVQTLPVDTTRYKAHKATLQSNG